MTGEKEVEYSMLSPLVGVGRVNLGAAASRQHQVRKAVPSVKITRDLATTHLSVMSNSG